MRSFCVAMMHIFCQSLIGYSRSIDRAAHGPQTRQMAVFDLCQSENYVRCCRLLAASVLLPFVPADFFLTQPRSKVCRSVASIFFRPRVVERESKMCSLFCARGLRTSDAIPEATRAEKFTLDSLSTTVSFKYAPTATQPSISYYNVRKIITVCGKKRS